MAEDEACKVHIQYTFNAFCKIVIRHAAIDIILKLRRRWEREVSLDYLMNEKFEKLSRQRNDRQERRGFVQAKHVQRGDRFRKENRPGECAVCGIRHSELQSQLAVQLVLLGRQVLRRIRHRKAQQPDRTARHAGLAQQALRQRKQSG